MVTVYDKVRNGYRYELTELMATNFHLEFQAQLTSEQMLHLGAFCGKYMTDTTDEFPGDWFTNAKLSPGRRDCTLNHFGVDASLPLSM
jgi:hypothetical protein